MRMYIQKSIVTVTQRGVLVMTEDKFYYNDKKGEVMRTIWKYELKLGENKIKVPTNFSVLTAQEQDGKIILWGEVDSKDEMGERAFLVVFTGNEIDEGLALEYISTIQIQNELEGVKVRLVYHVFEVL